MTATDGKAPARRMHWSWMPGFVRWTGVISIVSGAAMQVPAVAAALLPGVPQSMLTHLFGAMAMFLGIMLVLSARDLARRGSLAAWEGVLRLGGFAIMAWAGIFGGGGLPLIGGGLFDLTIGLVYLVGLPKHLGRPFSDLLLDR